MAALLASAATLALGCDGAPLAREVTSDAVGAFAHERGRRMLTFTGYSGAGYEDPAAMLGHAARVLDRHDPARTIVNIGATAEGIGAVYRLARERGFTTIGVVSTLARADQSTLSPCVQYVFFIADDRWGGHLPGSERLSPTSAAIVAHSASMVGIGGGEVARDEMLAARRAGNPVSFIPADMDHRLAREKALRSGEPEPTDFRGAAHAALAGGP
jgi:hypothetical protein